MSNYTISYPVPVLGEDGQVQILEDGSIAMERCTHDHLATVSLTDGLWEIYFSPLTEADDDEHEEHDCPFGSMQAFMFDPRRGATYKNPITSKEQGVEIFLDLFPDAELEEVQ